MAMLFEGLVGVMALIAASALHPGDYFAINTTPAVFATLNIPIVNLMDLQSQVGETVVGRTGGAVSLAVGMAQIFASISGHARADGLLVSLRDHVRGGLHLDDDRFGHARGPLPAAGIDRSRLAEIRRHESWLPARCSVRA